MIRNKFVLAVLGAAVLFAHSPVVGAAPAGKTKRAVPASTARVSGSININRASARQLQMLPRIGRSTAKRIVAYRAKAPFNTVRDLMKVKGVGKRTFVHLKRYLSVSGATTLKVWKKKRAKRARRGKRRRSRTKASRCRCRAS